MLSVLARSCRSRRLIRRVVAALAGVVVGTAAGARPVLMCAGMAHAARMASASPAAHHHGGAEHARTGAPAHDPGRACCPCCACAACGVVGPAALPVLSASEALASPGPRATLAPAERPSAPAPHRQPFAIGPPAPLVV